MSLPVSCEVLSPSLRAARTVTSKETAVVEAAGRVPPRVTPHPPPSRYLLGWGSSGFFTEPGCVTAARPREPSGVLKHARRRCGPRAGLPVGAGRKQRRAVGRTNRDDRGQAKSERHGPKPRALCGPHPRGCAPRAAREVGASPRLFRRSRRCGVLVSRLPHRRPLRSEPPRQGGLGRRVAPACVGRSLLWHVPLRSRGDKLGGRRASPPAPAGRRRGGAGARSHGCARVSPSRRGRWERGASAARASEFERSISPETKLRSATRLLARGVAERGGPPGPEGVCRPSGDAQRRPCPGGRACRRARVLPRVAATWLILPV